MSAVSWKTLNAVDLSAVIVKEPPECWEARVNHKWDSCLSSLLTIIHVFCMQGTLPGPGTQQCHLCCHRAPGLVEGKTDTHTHMYTYTFPRGRERGAERASSKRSAHRSVSLSAGSANETTLPPHLPAWYAVVVMSFGGLAETHKRPEESLFRPLPPLGWAPVTALTIPQ